MVFLDPREIDAALSWKVQKKPEIETVKSKQTCKPTIVILTKAHMQ